MCGEGLVVSVELDPVTLVLVEKVVGRLRRRVICEVRYVSLRSAYRGRRGSPARRPTGSLAPRPGET